MVVYWAPSSNTQMYIAVKVDDDSTATNQLQFNKLRMSYDKDNFSSSAPGYREYTSTYITGNGQEYYVALVNTADFATDSVVYMRYYVNDGNHTQNTEFPLTTSILPYKTFFSFYVTP